ncbi:MAG TPA: DNA repair protein RadC [Bacteroidia bacterium]|nr:DNA repair protein RadC [Bacteroidia bacterium]
MIEEQVKKSIRNWNEQDRPREKLLEHGCKALTDAELIAILIGSGNRNESAVELSRRILDSNNNDLNQLGKLSVKDLMKFNGIGEAKALSIVATLEIGRRRRSTEMKERDKITSSKDVHDFFNHLGDLPNEEFWILLLNRSNKIIGKKNISKGGIAGTVVDSKIIFKHAIDQLAESIILCHNHPSGNLQPSNEDISITKKISEAAKLFDVKVLDHVIVAETGYYSFADEGKM